ncbi:MAG TPA: hypothetical protein PKY13_05135 [Microthrixaceae bacterium]|jgi:SWI/SNF-related matrix-associated actin-dependent regulator 1 of chromatin subfamily A|nr:hypothetical protein [Microthrixaceae bacterium]
MNAAAPSSAEADVAELRAAVGDLQALVATLLERPAAAAPVATPAAAPVVGASRSSIEASDTAARIIVAANEAAEAAVMTARAEADQIIAAAKVKSFEIVGVARDLADSELTAERNRVATATEVWNGSRASLAAQLASLDASLSAYRTELAATAGAVADAIAQLGDAVPAGDVPPGAESSNAAMAAPVPGDAPMRSSRSGSAVSAGPSAAFAVGSTHQQRAGVFGR